MKADFKSLWQLILVLLSSGIVGCYSVHFEPVPNYPVLKRTLPPDVEIELRSAPPPQSYTRLGSLIVHDASLDLQDESFRTFLKDEIRKRGARGGIIQYLGRRYHDSIQAGVHDQTMHYTPTGDMQVEVFELRILLFNYLEKTPEKNHD